MGFLRWLTGSRRLAYHLARKKVPYFDVKTGSMENPTIENALKFELFIFDALPLADRWLAVETSRAEEFAPLKNATGPDSPETVHAAISRLHASWLKAAGVAIPETSAGAPRFPIEISPLFALDRDECAAVCDSNTAIAGPTYLRR